MELAEVPTRNLTYHIVECRLEESRSGLRHRVLQVEQSVTQTEFSGYKRQRIPRSFRSQRRRTAQTGIHLDNPIIFRFGVKSILHVTFAYDADMTDDTDSQFAKLMILAIGQGLARSDNDRLAGMNAQRVEILHVADRDTVIETVAHHFIFHFLPAFQALFHQHLGRERKRFLCQHVQFVLVIAKA